eukprot:4911013-Amphidinium_carterae.1
MPLVKVWQHIGILSSTELASAAGIAHEEGQCSSKINDVVETLKEGQLVWAHCKPHLQAKQEKFGDHI